MLTKINLSIEEDLWFKFRKRFPYCASRLFSRVVDKCLNDTAFFNSIFFGENENYPDCIVRSDHYE